MPWVKLEQQILIVSRIEAFQYLMRFVLDKAHLGFCGFATGTENDGIGTEVIISGCNPARQDHARLCSHSQGRELNPFYTPRYTANSYD